MVARTSISRLIRRSEQAVSRQANRPFGRKP